MKSGVSTDFAPVNHRFSIHTRYIHNTYTIIDIVVSLVTVYYLMHANCEVAIIQQIQTHLELAAIGHYKLLSRRILNNDSIAINFRNIIRKRPLINNRLVINR